MSKKNKLEDFEEQNITHVNFEESENKRNKKNKIFKNIGFWIGIAVIGVAVGITALLWDREN